MLVSRNFSGENDFGIDIRRAEVLWHKFDVTNRLQSELWIGFGVTDEFVS